MPNKPPPPTGPTRRTFETLLRELNDRLGWRYGEDAEFQAAERKFQEIEKRLMNSPALKRAKAALAHCRRKQKQKREQLKNRLIKVRNLYYAKGLVPSVIVLMNALVEDVNRNDTARAD